MVALKMHCRVAEPQNCEIGPTCLFQLTALNPFIFLIKILQKFLRCLQEFFRSHWKFSENSFIVFENSFVVYKDSFVVYESCSPASTRGWEIVQTHNIIPDRLGNIYSFKKIFFCENKMDSKKKLKYRVIRRIT